MATLDEAIAKFLGNREAKPYGKDNSEQVLVTPDQVLTAKSLTEVEPPVAVLVLRENEGWQVAQRYE